METFAYISVILLCVLFLMSVLWHMSIAGLRREKEIQSALNQRGNTLLKYEVDSENDNRVHVRYRDKDGSLHALTFRRTWFGLKKIDERIIRNHNAQFVVKNDTSRGDELK